MINFACHDSDRAQKSENGASERRTLVGIIDPKMYEKRRKITSTSKASLKCNSKNNIKFKLSDKVKNKTH